MASKNTFFPKFLDAIKEWGTLVISIITFAWSCIQKKGNEIDLNSWLIWGGVAILLITIVSIWNNWPKKKCSSDFFPGSGNTRIKIIIQKGSVLKQKGIKVIYVQDTFETSIKKCEEESLLHAFLSLSEVNKHDLDISIEASLKSNGYTSSVIPYPLSNQLNAANMKTLKYEIGAVAEYKKDYLLVAFSNIKDDEGHVKEKNYDQYIDSVNKVFSCLKKDHKGSAVNQTYNVGVWGFQYNGGLYDPHKKIVTMVRSFIKISQQKPFCETLRICVNGKHAERIDFKKMQVLLDYIVDTTE